jgi:hypothetical protein
LYQLGKPPDAAFDLTPQDANILGPASQRLCLPVPVIFRVQQQRHYQTSPVDRQHRLSTEQDHGVFFRLDGMQPILSLEPRTALLP